MDGAQALSRATGLYKVLGKAGFTRSTFMELGEAADSNRPFRLLSTQLKMTLFRLIAAYDGELKGIEAEEKTSAEAFAQDAEEVTEDELVQAAPAVAATDEDGEDDAADAEDEEEDTGEEGEDGEGGEEALAAAPAVVTTEPVAPATVDTAEAPPAVDSEPKSAA